MDILIKNAKVFGDNGFADTDYLISADDEQNGYTDRLSGIVCRLNNCYVFPAFCDVHVHLREPGFSYKETIKAGTTAAAHGGFTDIFTMPNLNPVPDNIDSLNIQLNLIRKDAVINVHPYASITKGENGEELSDFDALSPFVSGFSDDGRGVQSEAVMRRAMQKAKAYDKIIVAHCEDNSLLDGGYIHQGGYARSHGHRGICSESEWMPIQRDMALAKEIGCRYHVCHVSARESVDIIRRAKADGVDVTCETAPHYLVFNDSMLRDDGCFKMNPPIRSEQDRLALIEGINDGTIDMIATDHAPHTEAEKSLGLEKSLMGVAGLETAFPVLYTDLVKNGLIPLTRLIELMSVNPRKRFGLPKTNDVCLFDLESEYKINSDSFLSMGRSTPFDGKKVFGENIMTIHGGKVVWLWKSERK